VSAVADLSQTIFNGGELSPTMAGRVDIAKYANGCYTLENFIPLVQGPARRRSAFRHVAEVADSTDREWAYSFKFSDDVAFVLEFGDQKLRFFTNHGQLSCGAPAAWNIATNYAVGALVSRLGVNYYCIKANVGNQPPNATYWYALTGSIYEIPTPYAIADLTKTDGTFALWMEQSGDVIYIWHPSYAPRKLTRYGNTNWQVEVVDLKGGPFIGVDPDETRTVYASAATGAGITLTASTAIFTNDHIGTLFLMEQKKVDAVPQWEVAKAVGAGVERRSDGNVYLSANAATTGTVKPVHTEGTRFDGDTGVQWEYLHSGYGWVKINSIGGGGTTANADVISRLPSQCVGVGNPTTRWSFAEFSAARGYPSHGTFFRERLWMLRKTQAFSSVAGDFENFRTRDGADITADMAISINIASEEINDVAWVASSSKLLVGTVGNEIAISELSSTDPLGPGNVQAVPQTSHGSRQVRPIKVNDSILFAQRAGRKLRELRFTFESEGYATTNLTVLAEHVTKGLLLQMAYQQEPHSIVWSACKDGSLLGFTFDREQDVVGWHRHPIANGLGKVESVATIPAPDGGRDEVWAIARFTVGGVTKRYVGYMEKDWISYEGAEIEDAFFVDFGLSYDGAPVTTVSGLGHLEGMTVSVLADGATHPDRVVTAGAIALARAASVVHVGLQYDSKLVTMRADLPTPTGTAQGKIKRIHKLIVRLLDALGGKAGSPRDGGILDWLGYRSSSDPMGSPPAVFTGDTDPLAWPEGYETEAQVCIVQQQPLPMTVISSMPQLVTS
jgi:hypothetical protein